MEIARQARHYHQRSVFLSAKNNRPWVRARIAWEFMRRESHICRPYYGPILPPLRQGRLEIGRGVLLLPGCWITAPEEATIRIGSGTTLNMGVMVAAYERVDIGAHCMFANGCFISDADHRFDDPTRNLSHQGYRVKGPTVIGDNVWCGVNVAVLGGVTIGERSVIGANSVVVDDIEPYCVAAGAPAKVIRRITPGEAGAGGISPAAS